MGELDRVRELIEEWHRDEEIEERKKRVSEVFKNVFGVEPQRAEIYNGYVFAVRFFNTTELGEKMGEEIVLKLEEIASSFVKVDTINSLTLKVSEDPKANTETKWESYWSKSLDYYDIIRRKMIKGYRIEMIIETPISFEDC